MEIWYSLLPFGISGIHLCCFLSIHGLPDGNNHLAVLPHVYVLFLYFPCTLYINPIFQLPNPASIFQGMPGNPFSQPAFHLCSISVPNPARHCPSIPSSPYTDKSLCIFKKCHITFLSFIYIRFACNFPRCMHI